jgi:hypothetical protein
MKLFYIDGKICKTKKQFNDYVFNKFKRFSLTEEDANELYSNLIDGNTCDIKEGVDITEVIDSLYFKDAKEICSNYMSNAEEYEYEEYEELQNSGDTVAFAKLTLDTASSHMLYDGQFISCFDTNTGLFGLDVSVTGSNFYGIYLGLDWRQLPEYFEKWPKNRW